MQTIKNTIINNGSIRLPKDVAVAWKNAVVDVRASENMVVIKKIERPNFWDTWNTVGNTKTSTKKRDITDTVQWARRLK